MAGTWLPKAEGALVVWFINFAAKFSGYAATLGMGLPETGAVNADLAALQYLVNMSATAKTRTEDINDYKRQLIYGPGPIGAYPTAPTFGAAPAQVLANIIQRLDVIVARAKASPNYTTAMGEDMGIEAPASVPGADPLELVPAARPNSEVEVGFNKQNYDGVHLEGQRGNEVTWTVLGNDAFSPYVDTRAPLVAGQPEVRKYRGRYLDGDTPIGDWSDIVQVSTTP